MPSTEIKYCVSWRNCSIIARKWRSWCRSMVPWCCMFCFTSMTSKVNQSDNRSRNRQQRGTFWMQVTAKMMMMPLRAWQLSWAHWSDSTPNPNNSVSAYARFQSSSALLNLRWTRSTPFKMTLRRHLKPYLKEREFRRISAKKTALWSGSTAIKMTHTNIWIRCSSRWGRVMNFPKSYTL